MGWRGCACSLHTPQCRYGSFNNLESDNAAAASGIRTVTAPLAAQPPPVPSPTPQELDAKAAEIDATIKPEGSGDSDGGGSGGANGSAPGEAAVEDAVRRQDVDTLYADSGTAAIPMCKQPPSLVGLTLRPYQRRALYWMLARELHDAKEDDLGAELTSMLGTIAAAGASSNEVRVHNPAVLRLVCVLVCLCVCVSVFAFVCVLSVAALTLLV